MKKDDVRHLLRTYQPSAPDETKALAAALALLDRVEEPWSREETAGHLTSSAWVVNEDRTKVLLVYHAKIKMWVQPGGHIEPHDVSLAAAALREVREETGLNGLRLAHEGLFDVAQYHFPAHGSMPEHQHYDCRFLIIADDAEPLTCSHESHGVKWFTLEEAFAVNYQEPHHRMLAKTKTA